MTDYISRDDALDALCTGCDICKRLEIDIKDKCDWHEAIKTAPAADVVEVVRCKDCNYYGVYSDGFCEAWEEMTKPNGYCHIGERVSEDE